MVLDGLGDCIGVFVIVFGESNKLIRVKILFTFCFGDFLPFYFRIYHTKQCSNFVATINRRCRKI